MERKYRPITILVIALCLLSKLSVGQDQSAKVIVNWEKVVSVSQTTPTLQVVVNPPLAARDGHPRQCIQVAS